MNTLWEYVEPWLMYGVLSFLSVFCPWALDQLRATHWYQNRGPVVRKVIDIAGAQALRFFLPKILLARTVYQTDLKIAVQDQVKELMPQADRLRDTYGGNLPFHHGNLLKESAVQGAMQTIATEAPEIFKAIPAQSVQAGIIEKIKPAVKKERKRRKANPNRSGGAGAHP